MKYLKLALVAAVALVAFGGCRKEPKGTALLPPPKIVKKIPTAAAPLRKMYEAEEMGKELTKGKVTADADASNQMALLIQPGDANSGDFIAWGPYEEIAPGTYIARWRIKLGQNLPGTNPVLSIDISGHPKGGDASTYKTLASKALTPQDFPHPNKYERFDLRFTINEPFIFELRTQYLQNVPVYIDWASLELSE